MIPMDNIKEKVCDILVLGGGPAGLSAAVYAARAGLSVLVIERDAFGGAILRARDLANYPGGVPGDSGPDFSARLKDQAWAYGAEGVIGAATAVAMDGGILEVTVGKERYKGRSLIIATGKSGASISSRRAATEADELGIPGEKEYSGLGLSYCAVCDGAFFQGLDVYVVGEGETALEEALYLSKIARRVTVIHSGVGFRSEVGLARKVEKTENISFIPETEVVEVGGGELLTWIKTEHVKTGEERILRAAEGENLGLFVSAQEPKPDEAIGGALETENGYIVTDEEMRTSVPGIFAAGDVRRKQLRQVVTAAADGAVAAMSAEKYLLEVEADGK